jgi:Prokaryotic Cytochrome C oxidase subunit IV
VSGVAPRRVTVVFACLVIATCVTWWLGSGHGLSGGALRFAVGVTIVIAFAKIYFIGQDFMELRHAPTALRAAFAAWVLVISVAAVGLYVA